MISNMNNTRDFNAYSPTQSSTLSSQTNNYFDGIESVMVMLIIFGIAIFIIWVWSMISMINLNMRFKEFYADYERGKLAKDDTDLNESNTRGERVIEPLQESDRQSKVTWVNKKLSTTSIIALVSSAVLGVALIAVSYIQ